MHSVKPIACFRKAEEYYLRNTFTGSTRQSWEDNSRKRWMQDLYAVACRLINATHNSNHYAPIDAQTWNRKTPWAPLALTLYSLLISPHLWHRMKWSGSTSLYSGTSSLQRSMANLQRGWNAQPVGISHKSGGSPGIPRSLGFFPAFICIMAIVGKLVISPIV